MWRERKWGSTEGTMTIVQYIITTAHKKDDMTYDERKKALKYRIFLKEKRDGTIKARDVQMAIIRPRCELPNHGTNSVGIWP